MTATGIHLVTGDVSATNGSPQSSIEIGHTVQFYENESFLAAAVADFLFEGIAKGQKLIVIARASNRQSFEQRLRARGADTEKLRRNGDLVVLDAQETLDMFMVGAKPDRTRFREVIGAVIERSRQNDRLVGIRAYGEMVDVLWRDGNTDGAIRLEEFWEELGESYEFSLLCAYAMGNFYKSTDAAAFREICQHHKHVLPTESYLEADDQLRAIEISRLQQRERSLETELAHRQELERRLRDALHNAQLAEEALRVSERAERAAREEAENANRAKSEFLAAMSHELRTPLNAIGGHIELLEIGVYGKMNERQLESLARVQRSQKLLLSLINDVLNLARIEAGRVEYHIERFDVHPVLVELCEIVAPQALEKNLHCDVAPSGGTPLAVLADREKLQQIVLNLLSNAIKFTPRAGTITLDVGVCPDAAGMVCVRVRDSGIGIPSSKLAAIFEPFVQVGAQTTGGQGVGLGLAISRDLAVGMGGDLSVTSEIGKGTTFTLRLPAA